MREKKEARSSPKSDWMRRMREQRYEEQQQRGRDAKAKPTEKEKLEAIGHELAGADSAPAPFEPAEAKSEPGEDEWRDLEAEARKVKKGKR